jgi:phosphonate transport system substrate-binding protein
MYRAYMIVLFLMCGAGAGQAPVEAVTLSFTAMPDQDEATLAMRFGGLAAYLTGKLGIDVKYLPARSYHRAVKAFIQNEVQFAWFGGYTGLLARQAVPGSEAIAQTPQDAHFKSYFIANVSVGITPSSELPYEVQGKTFTFGAPDSTSGRLMPEYFIRKRFGVGPKDVFSQVGYTGDHSATLQQVQSGEVQIGAIDSLVYEQKKSEGIADE